MLLVACGGDKGSESEPPTVVTGVSWTTFQGMQIPTGDQGPRTGHASAPTGYDRSPAGAALAAVSATVRMSVASDSQWPAVGQKLLAPGPERDAWAIARSRVSITEPVKAAQAPKVVAYAFGEKNKETVVVKIYSTLSDGSHTENTTTMAWMAGDWRLRLPQGDQSPVRAINAVPDTARRFGGDQ